MWFSGRKNIPASISMLFQRCLLVDTTSRRETRSNQRWNNVMYFNVGISNVEQRRINVVYFTVETTLLFSTSSFSTLVNVETTLWKWPFLKRAKHITSNRIQRIQRFNYYFIVFFTLLPSITGICPQVLARLQKTFKGHKKYCIAST